jgi:hypothetical protein
MKPDPADRLVKADDTPAEKQRKYLQFLLSIPTDPRERREYHRAMALQIDHPQLIPGGVF